MRFLPLAQSPGTARTTACQGNSRGAAGTVETDAGPLGTQGLSCQKRLGASRTWTVAWPTLDTCVSVSRQLQDRLSRVRTGQVVRILRGVGVMPRQRAPLRDRRHDPSVPWRPKCYERGPEAPITVPVFAVARRAPAWSSGAGAGTTSVQPGRTPSSARNWRTSTSTICGTPSPPWRSSLQEVKDLLGHHSLAMTLRYGHLAPEPLRTAVARLDVALPVAANLSAQGSAQEGVPEGALLSK